jgi:Domain of unknown function (DUF5655)/Domain of unknown function (DUF4287)
MTKAKSPVVWTYDVHPGMVMIQSILAGMKQKTGRSLEEWVQVAKKNGPATEKERREWLKAKHGLGATAAQFVAESSVGKGDGGDPQKYLKSASEYVEKMFSGPRADLRHIYDALVTLCRKLGKDVKVCPCQTVVPVFRHHVFAQIKPTTQTRIDLGLALKDAKVPKRLIDTGGFAKKDRITRRIEITSEADIDDEVMRWLKTAYEMDA